MSSPVISVENISKQYRLGEVGTGTLSHDFNRWWHKVRGKEDPYLRIGETNDRSKKSGSDYSWALRDVSFEVKQGEVLGIIGRNGAGKSTLLKILSRVTQPTTGEIKVKGRIASLLEVGTGFHPELTGRENIYINGAILGMRKDEITRKLDEIIEFSGCERYIDTPVKRYSSGMYVRLAFAVAAHLEPEILIVDEVLAVGDAEFQKKCLGKMKDVAGEGRTVLFVSHNLAAVSTLCKSLLVLNHGTISVLGSCEDGLSAYMALQSQYKLGGDFKIKGNDGGPELISIFLGNEIGKDITVIDSSFEAYLYLKMRVPPELKVDFGFTIYNVEHIGLFSSLLSDSIDRIAPGIVKFRIKIPTGILNTGSYRIEGAIGGEKLFFQSDCLVTFEVTSDQRSAMSGAKSRGLMKLPETWQQIQL
jgi:lipopolysaccharide transport system ATP-binding protein